jgi:pyrroline-5-carboxylate reductase
MFGNKKIGFIGTGNMGQALLAGIIKAKLVSAKSIIVFDKDVTKSRAMARQLGVTVAQSNLDLVTKADTVLLCVKPQVMGDVLVGIKPVTNQRKFFISIMAGIKTTKIEAILGKVPVVRVMPNTPALIGEGMSAICRGKYARASHLALSESIFKVVGKTIVVTENLMDAVTGLSGSGPAYVFTFIEGLIEGGKQAGLKDEQARTLTLQTVIGAAKLLEATGKEPAELRAQVTSPGGTTLAGLKAMNIDRLIKILVKTVEAATKRSKALGK